MRRWTYGFAGATHRADFHRWFLGFGPVQVSLFAGQHKGAPFFFFSKMILVGTRCIIIHSFYMEWSAKTSCSFLRLKYLTSLPVIRTAVLVPLWIAWYRYVDCTVGIQFSVVNDILSTTISPQPPPADASSLCYEYCCAGGQHTFMGLRDRLSLQYVHVRYGTSTTYEDTYFTNM